MAISREFQFGKKWKVFFFTISKLHVLLVICSVIFIVIQGNGLILDYQIERKILGGNSEKESKVSYLLINIFSKSNSIGPLLLLLCFVIFSKEKRFVSSL